jgi:hypothetical protein
MIVCTDGSIPGDEEIDSRLSDCLVSMDNSEHSSTDMSKAEYTTDQIVISILDHTVPNSPFCGKSKTLSRLSSYFLSPKQ